ncbi:hypothetical protein KFK09_026118 [Dendrobium nobile]|uniref:Uncharacterized protein n=1 Tax=Dendrobium nobile TaxID=94219 RepID=A0A8T3A5U4_DENNO|nr:hypothetical protein KFK09_026118 [Dendrobium nobile]
MSLIMSWLKLETLLSRSMSKYTNNDEQIFKCKDFLFDIFKQELMLKYLKRSANVYLKLRLIKFVQLVRSN